MNIRNECRDLGLRAGIVVAREVTTGPSPEELLQKLSDLVKERSGEEFPPQELKSEIRALLKKGGFKPTGRNKPASEYLAQAAREGRFPFINNLVDTNNYISLLSGFPVSLLDYGITGEAAVLRTGKPGENYIFNPAGQVIDLEGLICLCGTEGDPLGNPVKDSLKAKIGEATRAALGVIYASELMSQNIEDLTSTFARMLREYGNASMVETLIV